MAQESTLVTEALTDPRAWVLDYLAGKGHNSDLAGGIQHYARHFVSSPAFPLARLQRICGPEQSMPYRDKYDPKQVAEYLDRIRSGEALAPLVVVDFLPGGNLDVADGNHKYMALDQAGIAESPVVFCLSQDPDTYGLPLSQPAA